MILANTIESDIDYPVSNAPSVMNRATAMSKIVGGTVVTIEPVMNFDLVEFVKLIKYAKPKWVNIGADSKRHYLPEPSWEKVQELISALQEFTEIKVKSNLERLRDGINR